MYIHVIVCIHIHFNAHVHVHVQTCTNMYIHVFAHMHVHNHIGRYIYMRTHLPPHFMWPGTRNWSEFDWRHTALRTTAQRDFSRAQVVCNNSETGRKRGWQQSSGATELLTKKHQNVVFWRHVRSSKRFGRCFCRNRSNKKNPIYKNFVRNLTSKLGGQL